MSENGCVGVGKFLALLLGFSFSATLAGKRKMTCSRDSVKDDVYTI